MCAASQMVPETIMNVFYQMSVALLPVISVREACLSQGLHPKLCLNGLDMGGVLHGMREHFGNLAHISNQTEIFILCQFFL